MLLEMPVELYAAQWRIASHPGRDAGRTADLWHRDLDALTDQAADYPGLIKISVAGPWTLAASIDLPIGGRLLRDVGAVRDLVASLAEGVAAHVAEVAARLPHARVLLQFDEPSLPAVLAGHVRTESGFSVLRAVEDITARDALRTVIEAAGVPVVMHCCAADAPLGLLREAGAVAVAIDLDLITDLDPLGEVLEAGVGLFAGAVATGPTSVRDGWAAGDGAATRGGAADRGGRAERDGSAERNGRAERNGSAGREGAESAAVAARIRDLWRTIGFSINDLPAQVVVTPACGLAGLDEAGARDVMITCREAAKRLADD